MGGLGWSMVLGERLGIGTLVLRGMSVIGSVSSPNAVENEMVAGFVA